MDRRTLASCQLGLYGAQNGGDCAKNHRPEHILGRDAGSGLVCTQQMQQRRLKQQAEHRKQQTAEKCPVKAEGRAGFYPFIVPIAKRTAHHAGGADAKKIDNGIEGQRDGENQSDGGVLDRIAEHTHKVGVGNIVEDANQRADDHRDGQRGDGLRNRHGFKQIDLLFFL